MADGASLGRGAVIGSFCLVASGARVGARCRVQSHTSVWAGVTLDEDVFVGPSVVFTNVRRPRAAFIRAPDWDETVVSQGATLGAGSVLVAPVRIGAHAMVGAGAVVTRDVPDHALVTGNPATVVGWVCVCGERMGRGRRRPGEGLRCAECGWSWPGSSETEARQGRRSRPR